MEAPDAEQYCSRHCAFKLSGFMDHNIVDVKKSLNLCVELMCLPVWWAWNKKYVGDIQH